MRIELNWPEIVVGLIIAFQLYASVRVLEGGTQAWERKGLALETGKSRLLDETDDVVLKPYEKGRAAMEAYLKWEVDLDPAALDAARSK